MGIVILEAQDIVALALVVLAAWYVARQARAALTGQGCGCGKHSCPGGQSADGNRKRSLHRLPVLPSDRE